MGEENASRREEAVDAPAVHPTATSLDIEKGDEKSQRESLESNRGSSERALQSSSPKISKSETPPNSVAPPTIVMNIVHDTSHSTNQEKASESNDRRHSLAANTHTQTPESSGSSTLKRSDGPADPNTTTDALDESLSTLDLSRPPPLNYTLRTRKLSIFIFWSLILIDSIAIPVVLYFALHYKTTLSPNAVFSISTGCLGGISVAEYVLRFWRLWKHNSRCRVLGARRWYLDWFHWNFSIAWIFIMVELIVGTIPKYPPIRLLAMPVSSLLFWFAFELLAIDTFRYFHLPAPIRISSVPAGAPMRPAIYSILEDVIAVDGSGGTEFRRRLNARYLASHYFRQMLHRLTIFWAGGMLTCAIVTTALVFTLQKEVAYVIGWALPFVWAGLMIPPTFWYVFRCLSREYAKWPEREEHL